VDLSRVSGQTQSRAGQLPGWHLGPVDWIQRRYASAFVTDSFAHFVGKGKFKRKAVELTLQQRTDKAILEARKQIEEAKAQAILADAEIKKQREEKELAEQLASATTD
jgi:hypothetical protein